MSSIPINNTAAPFRLDGLTAIVTGASRGIGEGCARMLAALGARVILVARNARGLEQLCSEIQTAGGNAEYWAMDLNHTAEFQQRVEALPAVHILVNNAGMNKPQPFLDVDEASFDQVFNLNVKVNYFCAQVVARRMVATQSIGSIIMMSSQSGHVALIDRTVYCATKFAMEGMSKAMALELAKHQIRVNTVAPTFVLTPMTEPFLKDPSFQQYVQDNIPLGRMATVDEVAAAVAYLAAPVSRMVTGTSLLVDGGWTMK
jgi:NAD(P)-dependent dehydrogenase (short-subunit alcohol dehydrogenase family)